MSQQYKEILKDYVPHLGSMIHKAAEFKKYDSQKIRVRYRK
jgi:hypothetical protein